LSENKVEIDRRPPAAKAGKRFVDDNPGKPCAEPGFTTKSIQAGEGANIGLLKHVLRVGVIAHDAARDAVELPIMMLDEQPDGPAVPLPRAVYELMLVRDLLDAIRFGHFDLARQAVLRYEIGQEVPEGGERQKRPSLGHGLLEKGHPVASTQGQD
jgi:hypothetical protein